MSGIIYQFNFASMSDQVPYDYESQNDSARYQQAGYNSIEQLQVLYEVRVREVQHLTANLVKCRGKSMLLEAEQQRTQISLQDNMHLLADAKGQISMLQGNNHELNKKIEELQENISVLERDLDLYRTTASDQLTQLSLLRGNIGTKSCTDWMLKAADKKHLKEVTSLQDQIQSAGVKLVAKSSECDQLTCRLSELTALMSARLTENSNSVAQMSQNLEASQNQVCRLLEEIEMLKMNERKILGERMQLEKSAKANGMFNTVSRSKQSKVQDLRETGNVLFTNGPENDLEVKASRLRRENKTLCNEISKLKNESEANQQSLKELETKVTNLEEKEIILEIKVTSLEEENEKLRELETKAINLEENNEKLLETKVTSLEEENEKHLDLKTKVTSLEAEKEKLLVKIREMDLDHRAELSLTWFKHSTELEKKRVMEEKLLRSLDEVKEKSSISCEYEEKIKSELKTAYESLIDLFETLCNQQVNRISDLSVKLEASEVHVAQLTDKLHAKENRAELTEKLQASEAQVAQLTSKLQANENQVELTSKLQASEAQVAQLTSKLQASEAQVAQLTSKLQANENQVELTSKLQASEAQVAQLMSKLETNKNQLKEMTAKMRTNKTHVKLTENLQASEARVQDLKTRLRTLQAQVVKLTARIQSNKSRAELTDKLLASEMQAEELTARIQASETQAMKLTARIRAKDNQMERLTTKLKASEAEVTRHKTKYMLAKKHAHAVNTYWSKERKRLASVVDQNISNGGERIMSYLALAREQKLRVEGGDT